MLLPWDTMSLIKAVLGSVFVASGPMWVTSPQQSHPLSPLHEPLHWRAKRDPKAKMLYLQSFLRKGVSLGYVGRNLNLKDLKNGPPPNDRCRCQNAQRHHSSPFWTIGAI